MKKLLLFAGSMLFTLFGFAQGDPDSDKDGVPDAADVCPMDPGTKANRGCPEAGKAASVFITGERLDEILAAVCTDKISSFLFAPAVNNKTVVTSFARNGTTGSYPVYYNQVNQLRYSLTAVLSANLRDSAALLRVLNNLFARSRACDGTYQGIHLEYDPKFRRYTDVHAADSRGVFFYLEQATEKGKRVLQLRLVVVRYADAPKTVVPSPKPEQKDHCTELKAIMDACLSGFKSEKGSFERESTPNKYYSTTLPVLELKKASVVESMTFDITGDEFVRKSIVYYNADKNFDTRTEALQQFDRLKAMLRNCCSGSANVSDETNQKMFELFTNWKNKRLRIILLYMGHFGNVVSLTVRLADED